MCVACEALPCLSSSLQTISRAAEPSVEAFESGPGGSRASVMKSAMQVCVCVCVCVCVWVYVCVWVCVWVCGCGCACACVSVVCVWNAKPSKIRRFDFNMTVL